MVEASVVDIDNDIVDIDMETGEVLQPQTKPAQAPNSIEQAQANPFDDAIDDWTEQEMQDAMQDAMKN
ncbi:MAG: hypothetical protein LBU60_03975 [Clostridiales bacterium]|nr:hypothetical protein [Clostridiales bacterium]